MTLREAAGEVAWHRRTYWNTCKGWWWHFWEWLQAARPRRVCGACGAWRGRVPVKAADASGSRSGDRAGAKARGLQCRRFGRAMAGEERPSDGGLRRPKSSLRLPQALRGKSLQETHRQNAAVSGAPTRHPHAGGAADLARAGDQTGIGLGSVGPSVVVGPRTFIHLMSITKGFESKCERHSKR